MGSERSIGLLKVDQITKNFGAVKALAGASLSIGSGEIRALLGANGSGKSTLVKALGGINKTDAGTIEIGGRPAILKSPEDSAKCGVAVAYQDLSLLPRLSVAENIVIAREPRKGLPIDRKEAEAAARKLIEKLNINAFPDTMAGNLDVSNQSLVEVAKALYRRPKILVLDEITASLHHDQVSRLFDVLKELKNEGLAILFVSHRLDEVFSLCDTATILREGQSVAQVTLSETNREEVVYHMTGKKIRAAAPDSASEAARLKDRLLDVEELTIPGRVNGASMYASRGEIVGIAGLQGQGQGEFMRAVYGAIGYSKGRIVVDGREIKIKSPTGAIKKGIGFISGDREKEGIFQIRPVAENLFVIKTALSRLLSFISLKKETMEADSLIQKLNIVAAGIGVPANSLSGGNQQKLAVGRWLAARPRVLLLDDPTKGVDVSSRTEIHNILRDMTKTGMAAVFSSSDNEELLEVANRIYVFYEGKIIRELTGTQKTGESLASAMLGITGGDAS
jgi:ABC-type sugar transport system ATPase subunit